MRFENGDRFDPATIGEVLAHRAAETPQRLAYTFMNEARDGSLNEVGSTYQELDQEVNHLASYLCHTDLFQERAILFFQPGLEYIRAFFACMRAGVIAVPAYPPRASKRNDRNLQRVLTVIDDAQPRLALTTPNIYEQVQGLLPKYPELARLRWIVLGQEEGETHQLQQRVDPDHVAFLQYTSGSTSTPKGVIVTHGNLMSNEAQIRDAFGTTPETTCVGWLPMYHDMGLIGNIIQPIYTGFTCHLMAPTTFLRRPYLWLDAISRHQAYVSGGPNFAYELCANKISDEQLAQLDLSSWRVAFNGSEPIRPDTLDHFAKRFESAGFDPTAAFPCYGLAEATLMVSARATSGVVSAVFDEEALGRHEVAEVTEDSAKQRRLVGSGILCKNEQVLIADPDNRQRLPEGKIGEIWVSGNHIARGYWNKPEVTEATFAAFTSNTHEGPFMRTGDLGFLRRGELFITGRLKELMIIRGRNHYPQDIEHTVQASHESLRPDFGAAFTVTHEGEEELVVVQEVERTSMRGLDTGAVIDGIREAVAETHELSLHAVVLIRPATLPKTTSGKVRRGEARRLFLEQQLEEIGSHRLAHKKTKTSTTVSVPSPEALDLASGADRTNLLRDYVNALLANMLQVDPSDITPDRPVTALGLDSLAAIELIQRLGDDLAVDYPLEDLLDGPTPAELVRFLEEAPRRETATMPKAPVDEGALSINQSALWLLHELMPESAAYHIPVAVKLGAIDPAKLEKALTQLAERHPSLRTNFHTEGGQPRQKVLPQLPVFARTDASGWSDEQLQSELDAASVAPLDLTRQPWKAHLYSRSEFDNVLLIVVHHVIADMWSMLLFFRELGTLYAGDKPATQPEATYADFVARQNQRLAGEVGDKLWHYWQQRFATEPAVLVLPTDRPRPALQSHNGAAHDFSLGGPLAKRIRELAAASHTTPFTVLLAAWQVLLHRHSGQDDLCVGSPTAGRLDKAFGGVIGDFVNPVVFRAELSGNPSFAEYLSRTTETVRGGLAHQEYPFELLVERVSPNRDPSFSPIFQAMFSLQKPMNLADAAPFILGDRETSLTLGGLELRPFPLAQQSAQVDVALVVVDDDLLPARLVYNSDLFEPTTATRLAEQFRHLLTQVVEHPTTRLWDLPLMDEAAHRQLVTQWNQTQIAISEQPLHTLFEAVAARQPDKPALLFAEEAPISYGELNRRANQLAAHLHDKGIGPEDLVAVCLQRHPNLVVALLAILKAGAAYVPLDPTHPAARTTLILEDAGVRLLLADPGTLDEVALPRTSLQSFDFSGDAANPEVPLDTANLAYMIYTSGSTGKPKGVQLCHRTVVNFLESMAREPGLTRDEVLLAVTTVSFDIAGLELYLPLLQGAQLVLATPDEVVDGRALAANIVRNKVTCMQATPSTWRLLLEAGHKGPLKALCGGEALPGDLARQILASGASLWNMYGPTETTIWSAVREVTAEGPVPATEAVGLPIANTQLHVLDRAGRLNPMGVAGELLIAGDGLARGYFKRPGLTAERFVPDPFSIHNGARAYRTGDLVRLMNDGRIDFLGRLDFQIKLRGFRIEIGEIEAALARHEGIREAVVNLVGKNDQDHRLIAYLTLEANSELAAIEGETVTLASTLRTFLRKGLPDYMVPAAFIVLDALPLTPNNKVDRKALPVPRAAAPKREVVQPVSGLEAAISAVWRELLQVEHVGPNDNFFDLGGHSMLLSRVNNQLKEKHSLELTMVEMFQFPTVSALAAHIRQKGNAPAELETKRPVDTAMPIAIIGMACRFPGADSITGFWQNLVDAKSSIITYEDEALREAGVPDQLLKDPNYVRTGGFLADSEHFDAGFFDFSPLDASLIDPQQRIFLEVCWHALEGAGIDPDNYRGAVGVFAGSGMNTYLSNNLLTNPGLMATEGEYRIMTTNDKDFLATRVAYKLNLRGPAINVQTACSTSLVAVHEAALSLRNGECDMALAGGSTVRVPGNVGYLYRDGLVFSPDGVCRTFDKDAGGTVPGSGAGAVLLKRLDDAVADGDEIYAVIKGSAVNNDASEKVGYTAPGVNGQTAVIRAAQAAANITPDTITYVEAHGTATRMGDPIEIAALTAAFRAGTDKKGYCAVGSVKTNVGHLDTAAGVAGLIKTALALKHAILPASLNFKEPNPEIDFAASPFYVNAETRAWETPNGLPRRAAISSFGIGGTNVHAVLEQAPERATAETTSEARPSLLFLSARAEPALDQLTTELAELLKAETTDLQAVARQLGTERKRFEHRRFAVCNDREDAATVLAEKDPKRVFAHRNDHKDRGVVFMFPGQGAQYPGMTAQLYEREPSFKATIDECCKQLISPLGLDLRSLLYPSDEARETAAEQLRQTQFTQPALFVVEYALANLLLSWGLAPRALVGHSVGEYVAATLAGVFTLDDALALVAERGRLIATLPAGSMLSVPMTEKDLKPLLEEGLSFAAINAPGLCVVSGPDEKIEALNQKLAARDVAGRRLHTSHAFHSAMMDPILEPFAQRLSKVTLNAPTMPVISNLSGGWLTDKATDPAYWVEHLRGTVRFANGLETLFEDPDTILLEVGPGRTLTSLARRHPKRGKTRVLLNLLPIAEKFAEEENIFLEGIGKLWLSGAKLDGSRFFPPTEARVQLPAYPFQRQRFWIEPGKGTAAAALAGEGKKADITDWFYAPSWKQSITSPALDLSVEPTTWLIVADAAGNSETFAKYLESREHTVIRVAPGEKFIRVGEDSYTLDPTRPEEFKELMALLDSSGRYPTQVVHCRNLTGNDTPKLETALQTGFYELIWLTRALAEQEENKVLLSVISDGMQDVIGEGVRDPLKTMINGVVKVIPQEHEQVRTRSVDLSPGIAPQKLAETLYRELTGANEDLYVAWRGRTRWVASHEPVRIERGEKQPRLKEGGTYLITGGLNGIGLEIADHLARTQKARLVLLSRRQLPAREQWEQGGEHAALLKRFIKLEEQGAQILPVQADVSDRASVERAVKLARNRFGHIDGVVHAAGLPGGGALAHRTVEDMNKVFAPKLAGTLNLHAALTDDPPEFMALFSSVNALLGGFGQSDYAAANAFLDGFALAHQDGPTHMLSINWDSWKEVGMAVAALAQASGKAPSQKPAGKPVAHPLFELKLEAEGPNATYYTEFSVDEHWPLNEHWILDRAILPGTTYLEMARAAYEEHTGQEVVSYEDVTFLAPLVVAPGERLPARTTLERKDNGFLFKVSSDQGGGQWLEHATGTLVPLHGEPRSFDVAELTGQHTLEEIVSPLAQKGLGAFHLHRGSRTLSDGSQVPLTIVTDGKEPPEVSIELGDRWHTVEWVKLAENSGIALMTVGESWRADLAHYKLHPGILDFAVGYLRLFKNQGEFLPLSYKRLNMFRPLPEKLYSHVAFGADYQADRGNPIFDISLIDEHGEEVVAIEGFALGKIDGARLEAGEKAAREAQAELEAFTRNWMSPEEGIDAFERALASVLPRVAVSTRDFTARLAESASGRSDMPGSLHGEGARPVHPRPDLMNPYVAPRNETEEKLAAIWAEVIGLEQVGIHDDFNDLGGDSLLITRIHARMKESFDTEISVAELMQYPNIADLTAYMSRQSKPDEAAAKAEQGERRARKTQSKKAQGKFKRLRKRNPLARSKK